jgi:hypothetical protein
MRALDGVCQSLSKRCLPGSWDVFDEQVPVGEQAGQGKAYRITFAEHGAFDVGH